MRILLIDNDDSFTHNLEHLLVRCTGNVPRLVSYSHLAEMEPADFELIVISAGPMTPRDYPLYRTILDSPIPILGICLGMQIINEHFGGATAPLDGCVHGRTEVIQFEGQRFTVARYHSLHARPVAPHLRLLATNAEGVPMALCHEERAIMGYQFHPESFMTPHGDWFIDYALRYFHSHQT